MLFFCCKNIERKHPKEIYCSLINGKSSNTVKIIVPKEGEEQEIIFKNKMLFPRIILEPRGVKSDYFGEDLYEIKNPQR